ncbi:hypothetical protein AC781_12590 [Akkermansia glycaniphila]|nr:hypothetical protein AC781_12590 [Akkermansia glycaniphila]
MAVSSMQVFGSEEGMKQALAKWNSQVSDWTTAYEHASSDADKEKLLKIQPDVLAAGKELWKAVPVAEFKESWAFPAVAWWMNNPDLLVAVVPEKERAAAAEALLAAMEKVHFLSPAAADVCAALSAGASARMYKVLESIYLSNSSSRAKGCAALGMAVMLGKSSEAEQREYVFGGAELARSQRLLYVKEALLRCPEAPFGGSTVEAVAVEEVYRLSHLVEGRVPPALEVKSADGATVKLPSTAKPTLVLFWSPEDETSLSIMAMMDEFRSKHPGIAVCPVVSGVKLADLPGVMEKRGLQAESYVDEEGKAVADYRLPALPYAYLIGVDGKTIYCGYPDMALQAKIRECVKGLEGDVSPAPQAVPVASPAPEGRPVPSPSAPVAAGAAAPAPSSPAADAAPPLRPMPSFK